MKLFNDINFKGKWRPYQKRVLNELKGHLFDKKLHVVAAPGSGKTILGLEAIKRIGKKAMILAPTITIREQWINRFENYYLQDHSQLDDYITRDINDLKLLTVMTYQGLHAAYNKTNNEIIPLLKEMKVETVVLDEAHHLRTEWWKSLVEVINSLGNVKIVALTATPPYDVSPFEWDKYQTLCGEIDAEISVPELVHAKNLCPHQDYVYFNYPTEEELKVINTYNHHVRQVIKKIMDDKKLLELINHHPFIVDPQGNMEKILDAPEHYTNMLVFLNDCNINLPKKAVEILGHHSKIPKLTVKRLEDLFNQLLFHDTDYPTTYEDTINNIKKQLSEAGCIHHRTVSLINNEKINKMLVRSMGKLNSIKEIVKSELNHLKENLKMVILTDYIKKELLPKEEEDEILVNSIGVVPIFEILRKEKIKGCKLGVISGSLMILPNHTIEPLKQMLHDKELTDYVHIKPLSFGDFYELVITGEHNRQKVDLISSLFRQGEINVLIGTKSLLGEGWDEPSINALILASFVGSYMLSNQMRGRAIRVDKDNQNKTANIWHLVCVENNAWYQTDLVHFLGERINHHVTYGQEELRSEDYETLKRRFKSFVGVSYTENSIENGIDRLSIINPPYNEKHINEINREMKKRANNREALIKKWRKVLRGGVSNAKMYEELTTNHEVIPKKVVYIDATRFLLFQGLSACMALLPYLLSSFKNLLLFPFIFGTIFIVSFPYTVKALTLLFRFGSLKHNMKGIGKGVLDTLIYLDLVKSPFVKVKVRKENAYTVSCYLDHASSYEKYIFNDCLEEILNPIDNPRYLLERRGVIGKFKTKDYITVPKTFGKNKDSATFFAKKFKRYVSDNRLIYTRDVEGRKLLLEARMNSLSFKSLSKVERKRVFKNKWQ